MIPIPNTKQCFQAVRVYFEINDSDSHTLRLLFPIPNTKQ